MSVKFKGSDLRGQEADAQVQQDIRELLFLMLHVQLAYPDADGNQTQVRKRLDSFIERRMVDDDA